MLEELASGERRAAYLPVSPPGDLEQDWSVDPAHGLERAPAPQRRASATGACSSPASSPSSRTLPAPTCWWASRCAMASRSGVAIEAGAEGVTSTRAGAL